MKRFFAVIILLLAAVGLITHLKDTPQAQSCSSQLITLPDGTTVTSKIADTKVEQEKGLAERTHLANRTGMLFVFPRVGSYPFWMKNTLIPLDILWLNNKTVVEMVTLTPPSGGSIPAHYPSHGADTVLELNAGEAHSLGLSVGSHLNWQPCSKS